MPYLQDIQTFRVFVATWNVGGKSPHSGLNLDDFLHVYDQTDIYVLGFQETVPLNAGNVLVMEDNGPAAKWLSLINQSLNNGYANNKTNSNFDTNSKFTITGSCNGSGSSVFFQRTSLKSASKNFRPEEGRKLKNCNCSSDLERMYNSSKEKYFKRQPSGIREIEISSDDDEDGSDCYTITPSSSTNKMEYCLIASKQMVGIFVAVWIKKELVQHLGHLRISCVTRGIMGCLGNKGCIAVSMSFHQTSFCFICSHLASGEKEKDQLKRNSDVIEILKNTQFPKICKAPNNRIPEKILEHDRIIWFGDLNYRIALDYTETRKLVEDKNWDALFNKDQLKIEREAGRVFEGWKEGKIYFAPTYKYYYNSDTYAGHTINSTSKRRTPSWCDRILWHGDGIRQLSYVRRESQFSDHRPVCATFLVDVVIC